MKTISLKLSEGLNLRLEKLAEARKVSKSEVVREAIEYLLDGTRPSKSVSALQLAGDLVGCCSGPSDASMNPKHMEGFGQ